eukprot:g1730.t1 g1730   contig10:2689065-2690935(-)
MIQQRPLSVYGYGTQWTGSLSRSANNSSFDDEAPEISPQEIAQLHQVQTMVQLNSSDIDWEREECVGASVGWGHSALLIQGKKSSNSNNTTRLMVCGRPHDFQTLMRLRRLPPFIRNFCIKYTLPTSDDEINYETTTERSEATKDPSILQRIASFLAGSNEVTFNEEEHRRYSNIQSLLEIPLPNGDEPAVEGLTAVISKSGSLYTFGLNHRGQCGIGTFSPNVWAPTQVAGLASLRFVLDHGTAVNDGNNTTNNSSGGGSSTGSGGGDVFKEYKGQENPIISVALGLQHGIALDSEGQCFCWGKGERGQLGQGRRFAHEAVEGGNSGEVYNNAVLEEMDEAEPNENRTFEYALQVSNFYDPYATTSPSSGEIFAPLLSPEDSKVRLISAGMNFSLAVTNNNLPFIWGKNCIPTPDCAKAVRDSTYPRFIEGLPKDEKIVKVACGSHHAAFLLEDGSVYAVGVATDQPLPMWDEALEILPPDVVDVSSLASFTAGFDRTVIVYESGDGKRQVIEIQLWSDEDLRLNGAVCPSWIDWLEEKNEEKMRNNAVQSVHRGWMHTVVVTGSIS